MNSGGLDLSKVRRLLRTRSFASRIIYHASTESTNDVARALAEDGASEGTVVCADEQMAGRGRLDRAWIAPARSSILMSIVLRPALESTQLGRLAMAFGLGLVKSVEKETGLIALLKWPNDLMINGRKSAGILTEAAISGDHIDYAIVGIGLNVNWDVGSHTGMLTPATSISNELGRSFSRERLLASILSSTEDYYLRQKSGADLREEWTHYCVTLHRDVLAITPWGEEQGTAETVDENGALMIRRPDGSLVTLSAADVSLHPI